jgi:hypothetical protein
MINKRNFRRAYAMIVTFLDSLNSSRYKKSFKKMVIDNNIEYKYLHRNKVAVFMMTTQKNEIIAKNICKVYGEYSSRFDFYFYSDHEDANYNCIKISSLNNYLSNEIKNLRVINFISTHIKMIEYKYFIFCDDDTVLNLQKIDILLKKKNIPVDCVSGNMIDCRNDQKNPISKHYPNLCYLSGGAGYIIPREILLSKNFNFKNYFTFFADVSVGLNLQKHRIPIHDLVGLNNHRNMSFEISSTSISDQLSYHHIKDIEMFKKYFECMSTNE